jgi:hypothetical protein
LYVPVGGAISTLSKIALVWDRDCCPRPAIDFRVGILGVGEGGVPV